MLAGFGSEGTFAVAGEKHENILEVFLCFLCFSIFFYLGNQLTHNKTYDIVRHFYEAQIINIANYMIFFSLRKIRLTVDHGKKNKKTRSKAYA